MDKKRKPVTVNEDFEKAVQDMVDSQRRPTPQERTRQQVHATGNKWAIENFRDTHN